LLISPFHQLPGCESQLVNRRLTPIDIPIRRCCDNSIVVIRV
jgi:hypothetical protein